MVSEKCVLWHRILIRLDGRHKRTRLLPKFHQKWALCAGWDWQSVLAGKYPVGRPMTQRFFIFDAKMFKLFI